MNCGICADQAVWICGCAGVRLCEDCFDVHCGEDVESEHQIVPIEEREGSYYTVEELREKPELLIAKIDEEMERLEGFQEKVRELVVKIEEIGEKWTVSRWVEAWYPWAEEQKARVEGKVSLLRSVRLVEPLPMQEFPSSEPMLPLPKAMLKADLSLETAIKVTITWNLPHTAGQKIHKEARFAQSSDAFLLSTNQETDISRLELPLEPSLLFSQLKSNPMQRLDYFRSRYASDPSWPLRCLFKSNGEPADLTSISLQGLGSKGVFADLALVMLTTVNLKAFRLSHSSIHSEEFAWICEGFTNLDSLELDSCKLANSHIVQLLPALPSSLQYLDLSNNYFDLNQLPASLLQTLQAFALHGLPNSEPWLAAATSLYPNLRLLA
jgi:hypothetical protein